MTDVSNHSHVSSDDEAQPDAGAAGLGHRAARGTFVTLGGQFGSLAVQMASVVILARLLTPTAYGLVAMVLAVVGVAHIFRDFGLSAAAIQAPTLSQGQRTNLFWLNTAMGLVLTLVVILTAPLIQAVYDADHLAEITRVLSLTFLLNGTATQFRAHLNRQMAFGKLAVADIASSAIALTVAIALALFGASYWALVAQQLIQGAVMLLLVISFSRWRPRWWCRGAPVKPFLRFGWNYVGAQLINYVANNLDSFLIGSRLGAAPAGLYSRAFQLLMRPVTQLRSPSTTVALPTLAKLQDDPKRYGQYLLKGQAALCYPITILLGFAAGAALPIVHLLLGPEWLEATPILRFLALAAVFQTISFVTFWVYTSTGIVDELRKYTLVSASIRAACVAAGLHWGVVGVAAGFGIGPLIAWPIGVWWLNRKVPIPAAAMIIGALRIVIVGVVVMGASWAICLATPGWPLLAQLGTAVLVAALACGALVLPIRAYRSDVQGIMTIVRMGLSRRSGKPPQQP